MKRRLSAIIVLLLVSLTARSQDIDAFRAEYEKFKNMAVTAYNDFRDECNSKYCEFLELAWESFNASPMVKKPVEEEVPPVIYEEEVEEEIQEEVQEEIQEPVREDIPVIFDEVIPVPEPEPQPQPVAPIVPEPVIFDSKRVSFAFFNSDLNVRIPDMGIKLASLRGKDLSKAWETLSGSDYDPMLADCLEIRSSMALCDWAYLSMIRAFTSEYLGKGTDEATLLTAFIYSQSGYKMRLAKAEGRLCMLFASKHIIYNRSYYVIDGDNFYPLDYEGDKLDACNFSFDNEKGMSLYITNEQLFADSRSSGRVLTSQKRPTSVNVSVNENLLAFYETYPSSEADNNVVTRWAMYANTPLAASVKEQLYPALREFLKDKNTYEATGVLLDFVQTAFTYEYDDKVWGGDRAFFAEESLYYPYCDCEDRSILFSRLVRDLLGLKVVLVYYPGHLATAVNIDNSMRGDHIDLNGDRYLICDPTYVGAPIGMTMPNMNNSTAKVILLGN